MSELPRLAYHEAGHALVARSLGRRVDSVSVTLDGGATRGSPLAQDASPAEVEQALTVVFAGRCAERHAPAALYVPREWADDPYFTVGEMTAQDVAAKNGDSERPSDDDVVAHLSARIDAEAVDRARALAEELVWRQAELGRLEALASELLRRSHLSGEEVEEILEKGPRDG
jgi:hypothetical protein